MRHPAVLPAAVILAALLGFFGGVVYGGRDKQPPPQNTTGISQLPPPAEPGRQDATAQPKPVSRDASSDECNAAKSVAGVKAREMMLREKVPQPVFDWVVHYVDRGLLELPTLTDEEMKLARSLLGRNEIIEWKGMPTAKGW